MKLGLFISLMIMNCAVHFEAGAASKARDCESALVAEVMELAGEEVFASSIDSSVEEFTASIKNEKHRVIFERRVLSDPSQRPTQAQLAFQLKMSDVSVSSAEKKLKQRYLEFLKKKSNRR